MTERMIAAIEHPWLDAIGHPTGRKIETRPPYAIDMTRVIEAAARTGTMIEINAAPDRRDMNEIHARAAAEAGVLVLIDSDAHGANTFELLRYGIATARRAWLTRGAGRQHALVGGVRAAAQARVGLRPRTASVARATTRSTAARRERRERRRRALRVAGARLVERGADREVVARRAAGRARARSAAPRTGPGDGVVTSTQPSASASSCAIP